MIALARLASPLLCSYLATGLWVALPRRLPAASLHPAALFFMPVARAHLSEPHPARFSLRGTQKALVALPHGRLSKT